MAEEKAYGPYPDRYRWRVVTVGADGRRASATYESEAAAQRAVDEINEETDARTVSAAVAAYMDVQRKNGLRPTSLRSIEDRLRSMLNHVEYDRPLRSLTDAAARSLFARREDQAGATQHGEIREARVFVAWCINQRWLAKNPFFGIEPTKPIRRGKPQLRIDEARKFLDTALGENSDEGLAVVLALLLGTRASEVTDRFVRDVDDGARILWIDRAKTTNGVRHLEIPEMLRPRMAALVAGRSGVEPLWRKAKRDHHWLRYHTVRLSKLADVPRVTPHGLRGTFTSLSRPTMPTEQVASALGHASAHTTRQHYLDANADRAAMQATTLTLLSGGAK